MDGTQAVPSRRLPGYGSTLLGVDLLNLTLHLAGGVLAGEKQGFKDAWPYTLTGLYLLSGPTVHLAYGRPGKAAQSLGVRATIPLGFVLLGGLVVRSQEAGEAVLAAGAATAIIVDAAVLGRGDYVGVPTGRLVPMTVPWLDHSRRSAGIVMAWAF